MNDPCNQKNLEELYLYRECTVKRLQVWIKIMTQILSSFMDLHTLISCENCCFLNLIETCAKYQKMNQPSTRTQLR